MTHWNKAFWLMFIAAGILVTAGSFLRVMYLDILLGFLVIAIGTLKLSDEFAHLESRGKHRDMGESLKYLTHQIDKSNEIASRIDHRHESRFLHMDSKRAEIENKIEDNYDSLAKKIIHVENRMSDVVKAVVEVAKRQEAAAKGTAAARKKVERVKMQADKTSRKLAVLQAKALKAGRAKR